MQQSNEKALQTKDLHIGMKLYDANKLDNDNVFIQKIDLQTPENCLFTISYDKKENFYIILTLSCEDVKLALSKNNYFITKEEAVKSCLKKISLKKEELNNQIKDLDKEMEKLLNTFKLS